MKSKLAAALVTAAFTLAGTALPASAITFEKGSFLTNPEFSNGFDGFGTTGVVSGNSYAEGGITVTAMGFATHGVNSVMFPWGGQLAPYNWYIGQFNGNAESNYVVSIKLTDGRPMQSLQFLMSSGAPFSTFLGVAAFMNGQLLFADSTGNTGICCLLGGWYETFGLSGGGFDEVRLAAGSPIFSSFNVNEIALDNITALPATPIPAALPLFATAIGAAGVIGWRRKRRLARSRPPA
jgi:hypothetical protein